MSQKEAIKTALEDWLNTPLSADEIAFSRSDGKVTTQVSVAFYSGYKSAIDSLAVNSKDLEPEIQTLVQENFWELAGKPAVEPSEEAWEFAQEVFSAIEDVYKVDGYKKAAALITVRDERIRRECADRWEKEWWGFPDMELSKLRESANDEQLEDIKTYRAAIMEAKNE